MKAIKLKSSSDELPIWGRMGFDEEKGEFIFESPKPAILKPDYTKEDFQYDFKEFKEVDKYELVEIEITIKR